MKNKYNEIANKIVVTPEMSQRILNNISKRDLSKVKCSTNKIIRLPKVLSIAACFIVLIGLTLILPQFSKPSNQIKEPPAQTTPNIKEYENLEQFSMDVDFPLVSPSYFPQEIENITYLYFWQSMVQITYSNENNDIVFRMSEGTEDISGDYSNYENTNEVSTEIGTINLKGNADGYNLALWTNDNYSFSISSIEPLLENDILEIVFSIK